LVLLLLLGYHSENTQGKPDTVRRGGFPLYMSSERRVGHASVCIYEWPGTGMQWACRQGSWDCLEQRGRFRGMAGRSELKQRTCALGDMLLRK
jgi:hypothetical protein